MQSDTTVDGLRLLVLDANAEVRSALQRALSLEPAVGDVFVPQGVRVDELAPVLATHDPHAVLIDPRGMPDVFAKLLSLRRQSNSFVVVAHVAWVDLAEEAEALTAGCALYCLKGMRSRELVRRISEAVARTLPAARWATAGTASRRSG
jgi:DNA-binding NarL/FixJ family response regulator